MVMLALIAVAAAPNAGDTDRPARAVRVGRCRGPIDPPLPPPAASELLTRSSTADDGSSEDDATAQGEPAGTTGVVSIEDVAWLYEQLGQRTFAFLVSLGLKRADAEDAHHEAWLKVVKALREKPIEGNYRGWVFQVMRNTAYDAMRRKRPIPTEGAVIEAAAGADPDLSAPAAMIEQEYRQSLAACLDSLEPLPRKLLSGRLAGRDYPALAAELGVAVARAHRVFHAAKTAVARCVQSRMGGTQ